MGQRLAETREELLETLELERFPILTTPEAPEPDTHEWTTQEQAEHRYILLQALGAGWKD